MDKAYAETDVISLTPTNNMSKDGAEIKCLGPMFLSNSYGNVRSRYLREPTGSCHDLCKYGRKHESEHDEKCLTFRRFMANSIALEAVQNLVKGPTAVDRKKKLVIKMKPSDTAKVVEQNIQPKKAGISDSSVDTNMLTPLYKHERPICSPKFIPPQDSERHSGSLAKEIGMSDNSINIVLEAHSPTHRSTEPFEKEIIPKISEQKILAQVEDNEKVQLQFKEIVESENNINVDSGALLLERKSIEISPQVVIPELPDEEINHVNFSNSSKNKKQVNKLKVSSMPKPTLVKRNILKQKNSSASTEVDSGGNANIFEEKVLSNPKESTTSATIEVIKQKNIVIRKQSPSSKFRSNNQNASLPSRKTNGSAAPAISSNVRTPLMRSISQSNASRSLNGRMNREEKTININEMPKVGEIKLLKSQKASISSTIPACSTVSLRAGKSWYVKHVTLKKSGKTKDHTGDFHEKTLGVIEPKIDGKGLEPQENLSKEFDGHVSEYAVSEAGEHSLNGQNQRKHKRSASKEEDKRWARRTPAVQQPTGGSSSPYKLKFKRGRVIELRTADSVAPRRLRFRRGRVLSENSSGEVMKRSFRRKKDIGDSNEYNSEAHAAMLKKANLESKGGMLKYQDTQGKKDMRALFNHVIEETASKLVETRKSKVKALVGAFETVISLQETKPASVV